MRAIIKIAGKQYVVKEGDIITIDKDVDISIGGKVEVKDVLAIGENELKFGNPLVKDAKVTGEVLKREKGEKIVVFKFKKRKRYHRRKGHRQETTEIKIVKIEQ